MTKHHDFHSLFQDLHNSLPTVDDDDEQPDVIDNMTKGSEDSGYTGIEVGGNHKKTTLSNILDLHDLVSSSHMPTFFTTFGLILILFLLLFCGCCCFAALGKLIYSTIGRWYRGERNRGAAIVREVALPLFRKAQAAPPPRVQPSPASPASPATPAPFQVPPAFYQPPAAVRSGPPVFATHGTAVLSTGSDFKPSFGVYPQLPVSAGHGHDGQVPRSPIGRRHRNPRGSPPRTRTPSPRDWNRRRRGSRSE